MTKSQEIRSLKYELACVKFQRDALLEMTWLDLPHEPDEESTKQWKQLFEDGWERKRCAKCHLTAINGICPDCENVKSPPTGDPAGPDSNKDVVAR